VENALDVAASNSIDLRRLGNLSVASHMPRLAARWAMGQTWGLFLAT